MTTTGIMASPRVMRRRAQCGMVRCRNPSITICPASVPVTVNYVVECFTRYPAEAGIVIGAYRIVYGLTISFYIDPWVAAVDVGWVYGMMAFFAIFSFLFVMLLMWKGHAIREWQLASVASSEEGVQVEDGISEKGTVEHDGEKLKV